MGFGADILNRSSDKSVGELLRLLQTEDLIKFGLIPEFLGRLPVVATLTELNEDSLTKILTQPKNALIKQFQKLFEFEDVNLRFTDGAIAAIAKEAVNRKTGARGLRSILEEIMLDIMYELPSVENVKECVVGEEVVLHREEPILLYEQSGNRRKQCG
jgi:ATP-dependent Clp protease ATP-binding subunit ClpX